MSRQYDPGFSAALGCFFVIGLLVGAVGLAATLYVGHCILEDQPCIERLRAKFQASALAKARIDP